MHQNVGRAGQARTRPEFFLRLSESTVYRSLRDHRVSQHPARPPRRGWRADGHRAARAGARARAGQAVKERGGTRARRGGRAEKAAEPRPPDPARGRVTGRDKAPAATADRENATEMD